MRVIALLSLLFGFMEQMILDGQTFAHAVLGIICGVAAVGSGLASACKDYADEGRRWLGRIMAGLGVVLAIFCLVQLPSAYQFQARFNERSRKAREMKNGKPTPNNALEPTRVDDSSSAFAVRIIGPGGSAWAVRRHCRIHQEH
jgi:hypothetical protein